MNFTPIIPIRRSEAFDDPTFLFELKYDDFRALADAVNGRAAAFQRGMQARP